MYLTIWNLPIHICVSSMLRHYFKYVIGAYLPEMNMQGMHILGKYATLTNVLNGEIHIRQFYIVLTIKNIIVDCYIIHMCRRSIYHGMP